MLFVSVSSCAFVPKSEDKHLAARCEMFTNKLTLTVESISLSGCSSDVELPACLLAYTVGVPVLSFVVSGGVVLANNTLHWLEFHGACEGGYIDTQVSEFKTLIET